MGFWVWFKTQGYLFSLSLWKVLHSIMFGLSISARELTATAHSKLKKKLGHQRLTADVTKICHPRPPNLGLRDMPDAFLFQMGTKLRSFEEVMQYRNSCKRFKEVLDLQGLWDSHQANPSMQIIVSGWKACKVKIANLGHVHEAQSHICIYLYIQDIPQYGKEVYMMTLEERKEQHLWSSRTGLIQIMQKIVKDKDNLDLDSGS